ncbi:hypothetical protein [Neptuniibacter sp.]|uniref:hypothetical protein n=1 Tax=Neptuniibacter sp. TaxID=1962643 RepID=UPI00261596F8|nr:hypothetical protein [Neptuniibacter sp.]MCP4595649.1 hypothetical protein [Neptuniibacter sp.]
MLYLSVKLGLDQDAPKICGDCQFVFPNLKWAKGLEGIIHFMTEPNHLLVSGAGALIYFVRKTSSKRS